jgi:hypothetical protein
MLTDLVVFAAVGTTVATSGFAAYSSHRMSILDDMIGDRKLAILLQQHGILENFLRGGLACVVCGEILHRSNLRLIVLQERDLTFTCDKIQCTSQLIAEQARMLDHGVWG